MQNDRRDSAFGYHLWLLNRLAQGHFSKVLAPLSIGPGQQVYLLALQESECIHQDALAQRLSVDKSNVTRALTALSNEGYLERNKSPADGRQWLVCLTPKGISARREVIAHAQAWMEELKAPLSDAEWQQLTGLLAKVCQPFAGFKPTDSS
ncbi:MarR family winged helix-turn-helix transcriptional regulator [Salinispirillum sp. LH 10-3-1]|uniref:MarR family winged helix-turn-helix transcriptional regulator n=1 Tax=Salinispirillum sp. LH 10-3-1 TaxID=2952525 RepID=A0AB38YD79_9GAMM